MAFVADRLRPWLEPKSVCFPLCGRNVHRHRGESIGHFVAPLFVDEKENRHRAHGSAQPAASNHTIQCNVMDNGAQPFVDCLSAAMKRKNLL